MVVKKVAQRVGMLAGRLEELSAALLADLRDMHLVGTLAGMLEMLWAEWWAELMDCWTVACLAVCLVGHLAVR